MDPITKMLKKEMKEIPTEALRLMNKQIVAELRDRDRKVQQQAASSLAIGEPVSFEHNGIKVIGKVEKINLKSVRVRVEYTSLPIHIQASRPVGTFVHWNVSPSLLSKEAARG